jgi:hypothetical protein
MTRGHFILRPDAAINASLHVTDTGFDAAFTCGQGSRVNAKGFG